MGDARIGTPDDASVPRAVDGTVRRAHPLSGAAGAGATYESRPGEAFEEF